MAAQRAGAGQDVRPGGAVRLAFGVALGAVAAAGFVVGTAAVLSVVAARAFVILPTRREDDIPIRRTSLDEGLVVLGSTPDSRLPGRYGFWFARDTGYARLGEIVAEDVETVTRRLLGVDAGELELARRGRLSGWFYRHPRELGVPYREVEVPTPVGPAPAWHMPVAVDASGEPEPNPRWAIVVHGRGVTRSEGLRAVSALQAEGWDALLVSYRNDRVAPPSRDGRSALGDQEWLDVEAAMRFALEQGAERLVLMGFSLGGATVLQTVTRSVLRDRVDGLVLDSPVIDWKQTLDALGAEQRVPRPVRQAALRLVGAGWGRYVTGLAEPIDLHRLDFVARAEELEQPILLLHSDDDGYVISDASRALAEARPDIVRFVPFAVARHAKLWNYDPERWNGAIRAWLRDLAAGKVGQRSR